MKKGICLKYLKMPTLTHLFAKLLIHLTNTLLVYCHFFFSYFELMITLMVLLSPCDLSTALIRLRLCKGGVVLWIVLSVSKRT